MHLMDCYAGYDKTLAISTQNPETINTAARFFRGQGACIKGAYDLKRPFAEAKIATETLPAALQNAIRENIFEERLRHTSWFGKLGLLTEGRREAAKARIQILA